MSVQIRCQCGKRYRVADDAGSKRLRCKECGAELVVPRHAPVPPDDEFDLAQIDPQEGIAGDDGDDERLPPRVGRSRQSNDGDGSSSDSVFSLSDVFIRSSGLLVFLATLGNCAYQLLRAKPPPGQDQPFDAFIWGILPVPIVGLIGLYIAWIGEEPDPETRRANRVGGLVKCGMGISLIVLGGILSLAMSLFLAKLAGIGIAFTGLMFGGVMMIAYGGLSVLTGRELTKGGLNHNSQHSDRKSRPRGKRKEYAGLFSELIALMVVVAAICAIAVLAVVFWPAAKPDVADANRGNAAPKHALPKFVPPALPAPPAAPAFPPEFKLPPVNQPAPEMAGAPPATPPADQPGGGPGRRGGFPRGGPVGPNRFRGGMPPTVPGSPASPGLPATPRLPTIPGFPANPGRSTNPLTMTARIGGGTAYSYTETSDKPMLGLRFELGEWEGAQAISHLKPIFDRAASSGRGEPVVAREGYVVSGLDVDADKLVDALRIIFVRIGDDGKIVAGDKYTSAWIGKPTGRVVRTIDGGEKVVVGFYIGIPSKDASPIISIGLALK